MSEKKKAFADMRRKLMKKEKKHIVLKKKRSKAEADYTEYQYEGYYGHVKRTMGKSK